jgi:hypothetical protein
VSWVEVDWAVEDPQDRVAALELRLYLRLDPASAAPTLVDFGAGSAVYTSLRPGQEAELAAGPLMAGTGRGDAVVWKVRRGDRGRLTDFAVAAKASGPPPEGWAHVMDRRRCLALAVDDFARDARDRIAVTADGEVGVWREYAPADGPAQKRLRCWLHFVSFPPQASAGASPQQMQSPLRVRVNGQ